MASSHRILVLLLLLATVPRVGALWMRSESLLSDPDGYRGIAHRLATEGVYGRAIRGETRPTAFRPPLYPICLAGLELTFGPGKASIAAFHLVLGLATVLLSYWTVARFLNPISSFVAALLVAADPILLQQSSLVMTETLATFLIILVLYLLTRPASGNKAIHWTLIGVALGLAALCRPPFVGFGCVVIAVLAMRKLHSKEASWRGVCLVAVSMLITVAPWIVRNQIQFGRPMMTTTHGGYTLWLGNNQGFYEYLRGSNWWWKAWDSAELDSQSLAILRKHEFSEIESDREHYQNAYRAIADEPAMFGLSCLVRVQRLWGFFPYQLTEYGSTGKRLLIAAIGLWYLGVLAFALIGLLRIRRRWRESPWLWGILLCLVITGVHAFFWSNLRMRAPLMPFVAMLAAVGAQSFSKGTGRADETPGKTSL